MQPDTAKCAVLRCALGLLILAVGFSASAEAAQFRVLHSFCNKFNCGDGAAPQQSLTLDQTGNLYGTATGGAHGRGIVFELIAPATGKKRWQYRVLYHFCSLNNCADGSDPTKSTLVVDTAGKLYGTTFGGGDGNVQSSNSRHRSRGTAGACARSIVFVQH
jgi:hypothetical protein